MEPAFDLPEYLQRIGIDQEPLPDVPTLRLLHRAHLGAIPFENLDIQMGLAVRMDMESLQRKMVDRRRGGYCFEQNTLFAHALREIGFECHLCEARVRQNAGGVVRPRTHMVLKVICAGRTWLADVGFGGEGILEPVAIDAGPTAQYGRTFRIENEDRQWVLKVETADGWDDLYAVVPQPVFAVDFEVANWYTSTHPDSPFVRTLTAQVSTPAVRHVLRNLTCTTYTGEIVESREIARADLHAVLREIFQIDVPATATFRALDEHAPTPLPAAGQSHHTLPFRPKTQ